MASTIPVSNVYDEYYIEASLSRMEWRPLNRFVDGTWVAIYYSDNWEDGIVVYASVGDERSNIHAQLYGN